MESQPVIYARKMFFSADHAATMVNRVELNGENQPHGHDFFEIALAAGGKGAHVSANGEYELSGGSAVVIRPGAWHGFARCQRLVIYNCCFDPNLLQRELGWLREDAALNYLLWTGPIAQNRRGVLTVSLAAQRLAGCLEQLETLQEAQRSQHRAETLGRLLIFLDGLARAIDELDILNQRTRPLHPAVLETVRLLESQIGHNWSLGDLAANSHLDPSYLVRLFNAEIGLSPIAYLNRCRVERAAGLLLHTLLPVAEVAAQAGWYDPNLFARRFRAAYGMSASEYRKRFGGKGLGQESERPPNFEGSLSG